MIEYIEEAVSGYSRCRVCNRVIPKGSKRGVEKDRRYNSKKYYCASCAKQILLDGIEEQTKLLKQLQDG